MAKKINEVNELYAAYVITHKKLVDGKISEVTVLKMGDITPKNMTREEIFNLVKNDKNIVRTVGNAVVVATKSWITTKGNGTEDDNLSELPDMIE